MKKVALLVAVMLIAVYAFAQQTETRNLDPFTAVKSSASTTVTLKKGDTPRVEISTTGDLEDVVTEVKNGQLKVGMEPNRNYRNIDVNVVVYYQELSELSASSSSRLTSDELITAQDMKLAVSSSARMSVKVQAQALDLSCSSSGRLDVEAEAQETDASVSSSGRISLNGNTNSLEASVSSSGRFSADDFTCQVADLKASSSGRISVNVEKEIKAKANSSGRITYNGNPKVSDFDTSSGGKVERAD